MEKIIFIYPKRASFIDLDINILSKNYFVIENTYNWINKHTVPLALLNQFFFILKNIRASKYLVVSFGGYWSIIPSLLGKWFKKPVFIILHGSDCVSFKEINYGSLRKPILRFILKKSYELATHLLPVSQSLIYTENNYYSKNRTISQGYKYFFDKNNTKNTVIHNAVDSNRWCIQPNIKRNNNRFITVLSEGQFIRKGGELIIDIAYKLPEFEFFFIGILKPLSLSNAPNNITFIPKTPPDELLKIYNGAKYYLQLSIFEGFGVALCEAMSSGCIPIVSNANILPYIIGETGYVITHNDSDILEKKLIEIHNENNAEMGRKARKRIIENFSVEKRANKLYEVLDKGRIIYKKN
jgi:glycosyltransferase involved in cell wall biosynthesis